VRLHVHGGAHPVHAHGILHSLRSGMVDDGRRRTLSSNRTRRQRKAFFDGTESIGLSDEVHGLRGHDGRDRDNH